LLQETIRVFLNQHAVYENYGHFMKMLTVNSNKSTTIGGVEGLIRSLQKINDKVELVELYNSIGTQEIYDDNIEVKYIDYSIISEYSSLLTKIATKLNQIKSIKSEKMGHEDVILIFHPNDLIYIPLSTLTESKIILVQTNKFEVFFKPFSKIVMLLVSKCIDVVTVYTDIDKRRLIELYPKLKLRIKVIPRGCRIPTSTKYMQCSKKLITIARIDEHQKNFSAMLDVFSMLPSGFTLDIFGGGAENEISQLKKKVKDTPGVCFKGEAVDIKHVLRQYSVFLMTSRYEGFGQTLIEARSQGLPIIAFDTFDALSWIVLEGYNGYTIKENDNQKFSEKIVELCSNHDKYIGMSKNSLLKSIETDMDLIKEKWKMVL